MQMEQLSVAEVLKYSRHDYLNDLQLILMNIDLNNPEKAKETILMATDKMKQDSVLFSLNLPKTAIWLSTFDWMYTSFEKLLSCQVKAPISYVDDEDLVLSLQEIVARTTQFVDVFSQYEAYMDIFSNEGDWTIQVTFKGKLPASDHKRIEKETFLIEEVLEENLWKFTIRGQ